LIEKNHFVHNSVSKVTETHKSSGSTTKIGSTYQSISNHVPVHDFKDTRLYINHFANGIILSEKHA